MSRFIDFPSGGSLFVDANIFLEHLINADSACATLFQRMQLREIHGVTSVTVLAEVRHRLLLTEAVRQGYIRTSLRALKALKRRPSILRHLTRCDDLLNELLTGTSIRILSLTRVQFHMAQSLSLQHHLLTNDALHIAVMRAHRIRHLASKDRDFLRVSRLTVWLP